MKKRQMKFILALCSAAVAVWIGGEILLGLVLLGAVAFDVIGKMNLGSMLHFGRKNTPGIAIGK